MKRVCVLVAVVAVVAGVAAVSSWQLSDLVRDEWNTFKLEHKKHYENAEEERHRMIIYLQKRHMIAKHNRRYYGGLESFSVKTNQFADMTHEEYLKIAKGFKRISRRTRKNRATMFLSPANVMVNESVDWRQAGAVSRVQNQLECNSCWAFSAMGVETLRHNYHVTYYIGRGWSSAFPAVEDILFTFFVRSRWRQTKTNDPSKPLYLAAIKEILKDAFTFLPKINTFSTSALEGQLFRKNKVLVPLSVQNLIDCSNDNSGCESGNTIAAFEYIEENKGIDTEGYYPYEAKSDTCRYNPQYSGGYDVGYQDIPEGDENQLKEAVATIGPVSVAVDSTLISFSTYSSGVYYDSKCANIVNHAMLVVGYGTDKDEGDYWLLKNSYGTTWGEDGYMRLARNRQNHCGIASLALYPLIPE